MFIVAAYDVTDDKRRNRLHKTLERFGERTQYSVFECIISPEQFDRMRFEVEQVIDIESDSVRYYDICEGCHPRVLKMGVARSAIVRPFYLF
jgi:CRISPR-associated protein Cas2